MQRYEFGPMLGHGGMGQVWRVHDTRLRRAIALKQAGTSAAAAQQLTQEALTTAALDHPGIVPIYDAGCDEAGQAYYTMRLIQGRTLAEVLAPPSGLSQQALLRHFLAATQAMAYAHDHGVVHRDLKPTNIMIGPFGETQVVDWGLATTSPDAAPEAGWQGTPAYMSPEQAMGGAVDARTDVWALGQILYEALTGQRPWQAASAEAIVESLRRGLPPPQPQLDQLPAELATMIRKATAHAPAARSPSATALAADLANYLDGKRVMAHEYTTWELLGRIVHRLRLPLAVIGLGLAITAGVVTLSFFNIQEARNRAVTAEYHSRVALQANQRASSWALAQQATMAFFDGAFPEAEQFALMALAQDESPEARGILAALWPHPRTQVLRQWSVPGCPRLLPLGDQDALCLRTNHVSRWAPGPRLRWQYHGDVRRVKALASNDVLVLDGSNRLVVLDGGDGRVTQQHQLAVTTGFVSLLEATADAQHVFASEGRVVNLIDLAQARATLLGRLHATCAIAAVAADGVRFWVTCADGTIRLLDAATHRNTPWLSAPELANIAITRAATDGATLWLGSVRGELVEVDLAQKHVSGSHKLLRGAITQLVFAPTRNAVWLADDSHGVGLWPRATWQEQLRLPVHASNELTLAGDDLMTGGAHLTHWRLPPTLTAATLALPTPIASLAASPDGTTLALGLSDGHVQIHARDTGVLRQARQLGDGVVKHLSYHPTSQQLAISVSTSPGAPILVDQTLALNHELPMPPPQRRTARRLLFDTRGNLVAIHWKPPLSVWTPDLALQEHPSPEFIDAARDAAGNNLWLLAKSGALWRWHSETLTQVHTTPGATIVAAWPHRDGALVCYERHCSIAGPGNSPQLTSDASSLTDLVVSADERHAIAGRLDGVLLIWRLRDGSVAARLRAHRERIGQLELAPDGRVYSAGWDGNLRTWDLAALTVPLAAAETRRKLAWGLGLNQPSSLLDAHEPTR